MQSRLCGKINATGGPVSRDQMGNPESSGQPIPPMTSILLASAPIIAAAGPAFLVWLFGGGFGLALVVFIVLKMMGK